MTPNYAAAALDAKYAIAQMHIVSYMLDDLGPADGGSLNADFTSRLRLHAREAMRSWNRFCDALDGANG